MSDNRAPSFTLSTIDISLATQSKKTVESIKVGTKDGNPLRETQVALNAGNTHREKFDPPLIVKFNDHILVSAVYSGFWKRHDVVQVDIDLRDTECVHEEQGIKTYRKTIRKVEVVVVGCSPVSSLFPSVPSTSYPVPPLPASASQRPAPNPPASDSFPSAIEKLVPTTDDLIRECAKFRVLVIGNSGVGKSTLIRKMFGVEDVYASNTVRGKADINQEFTSRENKRFVVHDSVGFEAGDEGRMQTVKDFVKRRQAMDRLEDQLHAIWFCVEIPHSGGRLVDAGVEQFLQHQRRIIGNIPLIVVLTKMDLLDIRLDLEARDNEPLESRRTKYLEKHCIAPLHKAAGQDVMCVAVCAMEGYYMPVSKLLQATKENMAKHYIHEAPRAMASIAQRVDMKAKIETSVTIGEKKYWRNLQKNTFFLGRTLKECLEVIRKDIVTVWNLNGLDDCLMDDRLFEALVPPDFVTDTGSTSQPMRSRTTHISLDDPQFISFAANEVTNLFAAILRRPYDKYQETVHGTEIFMSYIVNLICVVQVIFLLAPDSLVKGTTVDRAIDICKHKKERVNNAIKSFAEKRPIRNLGQDQVLKEIEALILRYSLSDPEVEKLRQGVRLTK